MDLKRAFETVNREILINKMRKYGINGVVLKWFKSYTNKRYQILKYKDEWSDAYATEHGVPQGSALGPILFIIYTNDIMQARTEDTEIKLFTDDTIIYTTGNSISKIENKLNKALHKMEDWLNENSLKMNACKTKGMLIKGIRKMIPEK